MLRPWKIEIQFDPQSEKAIYLQIADVIIQDIQTGRLKAGDALPGSRQLAADLSVNRNTVVDALNVLINEGWIEAKPRKGAFVADVLPTTKPLHHNGKQPISKPAYNSHIHLYFDDGFPDSKIAPMTELARAYRKIFNQKARWQLMGYNSELGDESFRKVVAQMLNHQRGMQVTANDICITRGSQMATYLAAHCLLKNGDKVIVENPGYRPAWKALENAGAQLIPIAVDEEGIVIEDVLACLQSQPDIKAIYITPHHQYPTTVTLSLQRRQALIRLSNEYGFTIVEDDYDNEFHFGYRPVLPLASFPELHNYAYIGTMSKVVAPALRIGYLVSNDPAFMQRVGSLRKIIDVQGDAMMEQAVLELISDGTIKKHIRKATLFYKNKRDKTLQLLEKYLKGKADYQVPEGGLAFWIEPVATINWPKVAGELLAKGIKINTPDNYSDDARLNGFRFGYGALSEAQLEEGISALAAYLPDKDKT